MVSGAFWTDGRGPLSKPQWQHVLRLADALVVSEARHKTLASLYRLIVGALEPSNGADTLRISPWTAEDLRALIRHFTQPAIRPVSEGSWSTCMSRSSSRCVPSSNAAQVVRTCAAIWACCLGNTAMSTPSTGERTGMFYALRIYPPAWRGFLKARVSAIAQRSRGPPTPPASERNPFTGAPWREGGNNQGGEPVEARPPARGS